MSAARLHGEAISGAAKLTTFDIRASHMKPVAICRYAPHEGPGYFATYLSDRSIPWRLVRLDEGEALPGAASLSGLAMMGGPMSVNDELPWIEPMLALVRQSLSDGLPVIGHCLGGQLLAKALGGRVTRNPVKEIGWSRVNVLDTPVSAEWGPAQRFTGFHWHGETFALPDPAVRIWSSEHCANQAFVVGDSIGMQCHVEMTQELVSTWCETGAGEIEESVGPAVQSAQAMQRDMAAQVETLHRVADRVYARWIEGLDRS